MSVLVRAELTLPMLLPNSLPAARPALSCFFCLMAGSSVEKDVGAGDAEREPCREPCRDDCDGNCIEDMSFESVCRDCEDAFRECCGVVAFRVVEPRGADFTLRYSLIGPSTMEPTATVTS